MLTIDKVRKEIQKLSPIIDIERGEGYFYMILDNGNDIFETHSIMTNRINDLSIDVWVAEAYDFLKVLADRYED